MADLSSVKVFAGVPENELKSIERELKTVRHQAGHEIAVTGDGGVGFMIISEGRATVRTITGKTRLLGPGDSFGEMALLDDEGRSASIKAETDLTLETIAAWNFKSFLRAHPDVAYNLLKVLSWRVRQAESEIGITSAGTQ
jgi:CRP/FNR family transcriptional regulator, cyclic AMP receptor protein